MRRNTGSEQVLQHCGFCIELERIEARRLGPDAYSASSNASYEEQVDALFSLAARTQRLHQAYGRRRQARRR